MIDPTIVCPLNARNLSRAKLGLESVMTHEMKEKLTKHAPFGVCPLGIDFLPIVVTTHGAIGPPDSLEWLESLFDVQAAKEIEDCGNCQQTARRRTLFFQSLFAIVARGNGLIIRGCTSEYSSTNSSTSSAT
jgi:hypothetical protein